MRYSSELTTEIANSIMEEKDCKLPSIRDCYYIHKELSKYLINILNQLVMKMLLSVRLLKHKIRV